MNKRLRVGASLLVLVLSERTLRRLEENELHLWTFVASIIAGVMICILAGLLVPDTEENR